MIRVLIEAEAGSSDKIRYDGKTLKPISAGKVSRNYPYAYGFILETRAADGDNVDCYILGNESLKPGTIVACEVIGLLDQIESGEPDHKVLAVIAGKKAVIPTKTLKVLKEFIYGIFSEYPDTAVRVGPIRSRNAAIQYIRECQET